jgi:hypothetical protein
MWIIEMEGLSQSLERLCLCFNDLSDWEWCELPETLRYLCLSGNKISSWKGCQLPENLWKLNISYNNISDWRDCDLPICLDVLYLCGNTIADWEGFPLSHNLLNACVHGNPVHQGPDAPASFLSWINGDLTHGIRCNNFLDMPVYCGVLLSTGIHAMKTIERAWCGYVALKMARKWYSIAKARQVVRMLGIHLDSEIYTDIRESLI